MTLRRGPIAVPPLSAPGMLSRRVGGGFQKHRSDRVDDSLLEGRTEAEILVVEPECIATLLDDLQSGWWISHHLKT